LRPTISEIYDEHVWRVYGYLAYRLRSREDAEDLTQATFERALKALSSYDERRAGVGTWLIAIATNLLIDHHRRQASRPATATDPMILAMHDASVEDAAALGLDPDLAGALMTLSDRERELLALRYGADLTGLEIAELTGLSLANVQQILSRSLRKLRAELEPTR